MKIISTKAALALVASTISLAALAPTMAQDAPANPPAQTQAAPAAPAPGKAHNGFGFGPRGQNFGGLITLERGAENVEVALVRLSHRLDLSDDQKALLETLKTDAVAAAKSFTEATADLRRPRAAATARPDLTQQFDNRLALAKAQVEALEAIQPSYSAFVASLTDEQKAKLGPTRNNWGKWGNGPADRDLPHRPGPRPGFGGHPNRF